MMTAREFNNMAQLREERDRLRSENSHLHHQTNKLGGDILRLRAEIAKWEERQRQWLSENSLVEDENSRLRELLREALRYIPEKTEVGYEPGFGPIYKAGGEAVVNLIGRIKAALKEGS